MESKETKKVAGRTWMTMAEIEAYRTARGVPDGVGLGRRTVMILHGVLVGLRELFDSPGLAMGDVTFAENRPSTAFFSFDLKDKPKFILRLSVDQTKLAILGTDPQRNAPLRDGLDPNDHEGLAAVLTELLLKDAHE